MLPGVQRGLPFDRASRTSNSVQSSTWMATSTCTTVYVYETNDINADPLANTGYLVTLHLAEGTPKEIMYRLVQQFTGSRCFVHSLEGEEFQGWKEVTEKNVESIGENLRVRNQMKVVKPSSVSLAFHESDLMDKMVSAIVGKLKKEILISELSSIHEEDDLNMTDDATATFDTQLVTRRRM